MESRSTLAQPSASGKGLTGRGAFLAADGGLTATGLASLLLVHTLVWTIAATVAQSSGSLHHDMTEAYDWGREFQLGYHKHPPLFAWEAGAWFLVFPRAQWAFYLLSAVNAAGGLLGVWALAGRLMPAREQTAALLLVMLTPFFSVLAMTFNANAVLLLAWPWTVWAFLRSIQTGRLGDGALFGIMGGLALLSKYSSILLLASCLAAALLHPRRRDYFASLAPHAAILACAVVCAPHAAWVLGHRLTTVTYVLDKPHFPFSVLLGKAMSSVIGAFAMYALAQAASIALAGWRGAAGQSRAALVAALRPENAWLSVLALGPLVLTLVAGLATGVKVSTNYFLPALFMIPVASLVYGNPGVGGAPLARLWQFLAGWLALGLLASPLVSLNEFARHSSQATEPRREIGIAATRFWHETTGRDLRIVSGTDAYGLGAPFYSPDAPRYYLPDAPSATPWITADDIARDGQLIICEHADKSCLAVARRLAPPVPPPNQLRAAHQFLGWTAPPVDFDLFAIMPTAR